ncbi:hypothetical protein Dsin_001824 [Dipteronia sinensis]|uniref:Uncharacterized protein n=1 Tax=Dipteronia sinensis TaxID=43782 RepID=A0AAE0EIP6_9ROSI|nr:hypothetical protein Dsin_001824 [Dipteronia sinensis]
MFQFVLILSLTNRGWISVWVRFYNIFWEYWHSKIISDIARGISVPLRLNKATIDCDFGHFVGVLVDVNVSSSPPTSLLLKRDDSHSSFISVEYENLLTFCFTCSSIGHLFHAYRWNKSENVSSGMGKSPPIQVGSVAVGNEAGYQVPCGRASTLMEFRLVSSACSVVLVGLRTTVSSDLVSSFGHVVYVVFTNFISTVGSREH